jgi:hypothetical protein
MPAAEKPSKIARSSTNAILFSALELSRYRDQTSLVGQEAELPPPIARRSHVSQMTTASGLRFRSVRGRFRTSGRYWDRTSDLFRVRDKIRAQHSPAEHENSPLTAPDFPQHL